MTKRSTVVATRPGKRQPRKKTLLCVTGGRPQVITQSVYALANAAGRWIPDEVVVVTTKRGRDSIARHLLEGGVFARLCRDLGLAGIQFNHDSIRMISRSRSPGCALTDIVTPDDDRAAGDFILDEVARITDEPDTELRVSLAGERYLIGFFAGHALSLLGRPQDKLMHVLVDEASHDDPNFFYPDRAVRERSGHGCEISIADVPFARIDRLVSMRLLAKRVDFATMCAALEDRPHLQVRNAFRGIVFTFSRAFDIPCDSSHRVERPRFEPRAAALYGYYAWRARQKRPFVSDSELLADPDELLEFYDACLLGGSSKSCSEKWRGQLSRDSLASARSRIGRTLKALIKDGAKYQAYRVHNCRDDRSYGLGLRAKQICFDDWVFADCGSRQDDPIWEIRHGS